MEVKILISSYSLESGFEPHRVYLESDFEQAQKDLKMMKKADCCGRKWELVESELFESNKATQ